MTAADVTGWFDSGTAWAGSHLGFFTVIATIMGIAGFVVALRAHRRARVIVRAASKLDATVEYDRAKLEADTLKELIELALGRRKDVASMRGTLLSGNTKRHEQQAAEDATEAERLVNELAAIDASKFGRQNLEQLAETLAIIRPLQTRITALTDKCRAAIADAETERDHALEDRRIETAARLGLK